MGRKERVDLIILPASLANSGLLNRLQGYSLTALAEYSKKRIIVVELDGATCQLNDVITERISVSRTKVEIQVFKA